MRLGLYESALGVLSRNYPHADAGEVEPGSLTPSQNPIVGYYTAFCLQSWAGRTRRKLRGLLVCRFYMSFLTAHKRRRYLRRP